MFSKARWIFLINQKGESHNCVFAQVDGKFIVDVFAPQIAIAEQK